jgi:hypothetical protein
LNIKINYFHLFSQIVNNNLLDVLLDGLTVGDTFS